MINLCQLSFLEIFKNSRDLFRKSNTIKSIYEKVKDLIGVTDVEFHESSMNKVKADNSKAKNVLGWNPLTILDEGLKITTEYYCEKYNRI